MPPLSGRRDLRLYWLFGGLFANVRVHYRLFQPDVRPYANITTGRKRQGEKARASCSGGQTALEQDEAREAILPPVNGLTAVCGIG